MKKLVLMAAGAMFIATAAFAQSPQQQQQRTTSPQQTQQRNTFPQQQPPDQHAMQPQHKHQPILNQQQKDPFSQQNNKSVLPQQKEQQGLFPNKSRDTTVPKKDTTPVFIDTTGTDSTKTDTSGVNRHL